MLFEAYNEQYDKKTVQTIGRLVLRNRPIQDLLFNYVAFKCEANNGVARISYDEIGRELLKQTGKERSKQAISKMVKAICEVGLFEYFSEKNGAKNEVGYFRISPLHKLYEMFSEVKEAVIIKAEAIVEVASEKIEEVRKTASKIVKSVIDHKANKKPSEAKNKPSKSGYKPNTYSRTEIVPDWFKKPYEAPVISAEEQADFNKRKAELQAKLKEKYAKK